MGRAYDELVAAGAEVITLGIGRPEDAARYRERLRLPFPVAADPDGGTYLRFGVGRWLLGALNQSAIVIVDAEGKFASVRIKDLPSGLLDLDAVREIVAVSRQEQAEDSTSVDGIAEGTNDDDQSTV